jgi:EmrB/QacA subfamily drug resistance transporter
VTGTVEHADAETKLPPQVRNALLALIVGGIAAILDSTMVTLALHTLVVRLHSSDGTIQWVTTGYLLAMAVAIPTTGWAESRWGGKHVWMAALVLFAVGSVLSGLAWSDTSLIGFRVLQGFAAGLIFPLMQTLGVRAAGGRPSSRLIATVSLPLALGPILGPVVGGVILNWLSWRWLFLVNMPVIAVGLVLAWRLLPPDRRDPGADRPCLDVIGLVLLAPALAGILLGLSNLSRDGGIGPTAVLVPLVAGVALLAAFCAWALAPGDRQPIVDIRLLRLRSLGTASTVLFTAGAAIYAAMFLLPLYYQQLRGQTVLHAGLLLIPQGVGSLVARFVVSKLVARLGARLITIGSFLLAAAATVPFALAGPPYQPVAARRCASDPRVWDRHRARPAAVGRLPRRPLGRHPTRHHEHPHHPAGRRLLRHRDRRRRPPITARPRRHQCLPGRVLVGHRHHSRRTHPCPRPLSPDLTDRMHAVPALEGSNHDHPPSTTRSHEQVAGPAADPAGPGHPDRRLLLAALGRAL